MRSETEEIVVDSGCNQINSFSTNLDAGETSSIPPNTVLSEEASLVVPQDIGIDSIDEQKLLGNGKKCHQLQHKAPRACKLLKKTASRNYWKKVPYSFIYVF